MGLRKTWRGIEEDNLDFCPPCSPTLTQTCTQTHEIHPYTKKVNLYPFCKEAEILWSCGTCPKCPGSQVPGMARKFPPSPGDLQRWAPWLKRKVARTQVSLPADKCLPVLPEAFCQILGKLVYKLGSQLLRALTSPEEGELYNWQGLGRLCVSLFTHQNMASKSLAEGK